MSLNKQKGNMYDFVTHTWNPIGGKCPYQCEYCYMKGFPLGELRLREKFLCDNLGNKTVFVGSSVDMWAEAVHDEWITAVVERCAAFPETTFLFQSKNPARFLEWDFPRKTILGTTLESNRPYWYTSLAPLAWRRAEAMSMIEGYRKMVSIEPVMDFDLPLLVGWIKAIAPEFVSIGADSKGHKLPEPRALKLLTLIEALEQFTEVKQKSNLKRLLKGGQ